jgi:hypothetical protein
VSPVKYELGFYIPEGDILYSDRREYLKFYSYSHELTGIRTNDLSVSAGDHCLCLGLCVHSDRRSSN